MVTASGRRLTAPGLSYDRHQRCVENWNKKDQNRNRQNRQYASRTSTRLTQHYRACQQESDKHRSAVAHEDRRGIEIEYQKSKERTDENRYQQQFARLPV